MKLIYEGVDITQDVSIKSCVHEMYAEKKSDSLTVTFAGQSNKWDSWQPKAGELIEVIENNASSGIMYVGSFKAEASRFTISAKSAPSSINERRTTTWEAITLNQIADKMAKSHGVSLNFYSKEDPFYMYKIQENKSDVHFLQELCELDGFALLFFNKTMTLYRELDLEALETQDLLQLTSTDRYGYEDKSDDTVSKVIVSSGKFSGIFNAHENGLSLNVRTLTATSDAEAYRNAQGIARIKNKSLKTGWVSNKYLPAFVPGLIIQLECSVSPSWNGKIIITKSRHDYINKKSKIFFRKIGLDY